MKHRQAWSVLVLTLALTGRSFARDAQREAEEYRVCQAYLASPYAEKPHDLLYGKLGIFFIYNVKHEDPEALRAFLQSRAGLELDAGLAKDFVANSLNRIIDRSIQVHGALGYSTDTPLAHMYQQARWARFADGADEIHQMRIAQRTIAAYRDHGTVRSAIGDLPI